jgi:hypothetical protein
MSKLIDPAELARLPRDTKREEQLKRILRSAPEAERFAYIEELLLHNTMLGLIFAKSCLEDPQYCRVLLDRGLSTANASGIRRWLECLTPKLGFRYVLKKVEGLIDTDPRAADRALYWMGRVLPKDRPDELEDLQRVIRLAQEKGILRGPKMQPDPNRPGHFLFEPLDD